METESRRELLLELHAAVYEQLWLFEVSCGSTELIDGLPRRIGPWPPGACSAVLVGWHAAGLLALCHDTPDGSVGSPIPADEAATLSATPSLWVQPVRRNERISLVVTELGIVTPLESWLTMAV
jgi:hypothetical protein